MSMTLLCHQEEYLAETSLRFKPQQHRNSSNRSNSSNNSRGLQDHKQQLLTDVEEIFYVEF